MIVAAVDLEAVFHLTLDFRLNVETVSIFASFNEPETVPECLVGIVEITDVGDLYVKHSVLVCKIELSAFLESAETGCSAVIEIDVDDLLSGGKRVILIVDLGSVVRKRGGLKFGVLSDLKSFVACSAAFEGKYGNKKS